MNNLELIRYYNKSVHPRRVATQCSSAHVPYSASKDNDEHSNLTLLSFKLRSMHQSSASQRKEGQRNATYKQQLYPL